jgi:hypothetical protein
MVLLVNISRRLAQILHGLAPREAGCANEILRPLIREKERIERKNAACALPSKGGK